MAYTYVKPEYNLLIRYIGTGTKPSNADIGVRLYDTSNSSHFIFDGTTWQVYKDASLYTG